MSIQSSISKRETAEFLEVVSAVSSVITYQALKDEIDLEHIPFLKDFFRTRVQKKIAPDPTMDPTSSAQECIKEFGSTPTVLFIPGQRFDRFGTRHGRGGGWYDRFLSRLPVSWIRVGVTDQKNLSETTLLRKPWDEPMDWILHREGTEWHMIKTGARCSDAS